MLARSFEVIWRQRRDERSVAVKKMRRWRHDLCLVKIGIGAPSLRAVTPEAWRSDAITRRKCNSALALPVFLATAGCADPAD